MNTVPQNPAGTTDAGHSSATTLQLMSHYARRPCPLLVHAIARQLACLSQSCSNGSSQALHKPAASLLPQWQTVACGGTLVRH